MRKITDSKSFKLFLPYLIVGVLIVGILFKFIIPQVKTIRQAQKELLGANVRLSTLTKKANDLAAVPAGPLKEKITLVNEALPSENDIILLMTTLRKFGSEAEISLGALEFSPGAISSPSGEKKGRAAENFLNFRLKIEGSPSGVLAFTTKVGNARPVLGLRKLELTAKDEGRYTAELETTFYYQPPPAFLGKISDPLPALGAAEEKVLEKIAQFPFYGGTLEEGAIPQGKPDPFSL